MANDWAIAANSLLSVLETARVQRQSGRLLVVRNAGGETQGGEVYLQEGQPIYARLGPLSGQDALDQLLSWRNLRITMIPGESRDIATQPGPAVDTGSGVALAPVRQRPNQTGGATPAAGMEKLTPQKRSVERDVLSLPLTRPQRYVYFMVDGHRTVADIARCTGKTAPEVDLILSELQAQGLVVL